MAGRLDEEIAEFLQQLIAGGIAVFFVEVFEVLEVAVEDLEALGVAADDLVGDLLLETGKGQQAGQPVELGGRGHAAAHGVHSQMLAQVGIDDLGDLAQLPAVLGSPVPLAAAHHIGNGTLILALAVHGGVDHCLGPALHQQRAPLRRVHPHVVGLQHGGTVFIVAVEQSQEILLGIGFVVQGYRLRAGRGPLELPGDAAFPDAGVHNGDAIQLQPDADDLQEEGDGGLKAVVFLKQFKGGGDQVVVQVACIDIGCFRSGRNRLGVAPQIIAEYILVAAVLLGLIQGPVRVFEQLVKGIARCVFGQEAGTDAAGHPVIVFPELDLLHGFRQLAGLLEQGGVGDILQKYHELIAAEPHQNVAGAEQGAQQPGKFLQDLVAEQMPVAVVDVLEKIQVDDQHSAGGIGIFGLQIAVNELLAGAVVIQLGQGIVAGLLQQLLGLILLVGDVLCIAHIEDAAGGVFDRVGIHLPGIIYPLRCDKAHLQRAVQLTGEQGTHLPAVLREDRGVLRLLGAKVGIQCLQRAAPGIVGPQLIQTGVIFQQEKPPMHKKLHQQGIVDDRIDKPNRDIHGRFPTFRFLTSITKYGRCIKAKHENFMESERNFTESSVGNGFDAPAQAGTPHSSMVAPAASRTLVSTVRVRLPSFWLASTFWPSLPAGRTTAGGAPVVPDAAKQRYCPKQGSA